MTSAFKTAFQISELDVALRAAAFLGSLLPDGGFQGLRAGVWRSGSGGAMLSLSLRPACCHQLPVAKASLHI